MALHFKFFAEMRLNTRLSSFLVCERGAMHVSTDRAFQIMKTFHVFIEHLLIHIMTWTKVLNYFFNRHIFIYFFLAHTWKQQMTISHERDYRKSYFILHTIELIIKNLIKVYKIDTIKKIKLPLKNYWKTVIETLKFVFFLQNLFKQNIFYSKILFRYYKNNWMYTLKSHCISLTIYAFKMYIELIIITGINKTLIFFKCQCVL